MIHNCEISFVVEIQDDIQKTTGFYATQSYTINWVQIAWKPDRRHSFSTEKLMAFLLKYRLISKLK